MSIYTLAIKLISARQGERTLTQKAPWTVAAGDGGFLILGEGGFTDVIRRCG